MAFEDAREELGLGDVIEEPQGGIGERQPTASFQFEVSHGSPFRENELTKG